MASLSIPSWHQQVGPVTVSQLAKSTEHDSFKWAITFFYIYPKLLRSALKFDLFPANPFEVINPCVLKHKEAMTLLLNSHKEPINIKIASLLG